MGPAVSIIIPAYNVTSYITTALDSVFGQSFQDFEVVVVNDGCPDSENLERAVARYGRRVQYIRQENGGVGAARCTAVLSASSPLIAQLDPDDWWEPNYLELQLRLLEANPQVDVIYPNGYYFGDPALEGRLLMEHAPSEGEVTFCNLMAGRVNIISSALIRKRAILKAGNFDPDLRISEDFDLWIRILKSGGKIAYHREPLVHYRLRKGSLTSGRLDLQTWMIKVLDKTRDTLHLTGEEETALQNRKAVVQMEMELMQGKEAIKERNWADARWHLELYSRYRPNRKLSLVLFLLRACPRLLGTAMSSRDKLLNAGLLKAKRPLKA